MAHLLTDMKAARFLFFFLGLNLWHKKVPRLGSIGAAAAGLYHSRSNSGSESYLSLHHSSWQHWILKLLSEARDRTHILMDTSGVLNLLSHNGNSKQAASFDWSPKLEKTSQQVQAITQAQTSPH